MTTGAVLLTIQQRVNRDERIASGRVLGESEALSGGFSVGFPSSDEADTP